MHKLAFAATIVAAAFVTPAFAACDTISSKTLKLTACIDESEWTIQAPQGDQEFLFFSADERVGLTVITEADAFSPSDFRRAILTNAKAANNGGEPQPTGERIETVAGRAWNVMEYQIGVAGEELGFQNFYYTQPDYGSVQVVFWSVPADATAAAYRAGRLLSTLTYGN